MTRQQWILLLGGIALVLVVTVVILIVRRPATEPPVNEQNTTTASNRLVIDGRSETETVTTANTPVLSEAQQQSIAVERVALTFAERFGSFASATHFRSIREAQSMMTPSMATWSYTYIQKLTNDAAGQDVIVTTRALATAIAALTETTATVTVDTQRREQINQGVERVFNQNLRLEFVRASGQWLVDGAYWE